MIILYENANLKTAKYGLIKIQMAKAKNTNGKD